MVIVSKPYIVRNSNYVADNNSNKDVVHMWMVCVVLITSPLMTVGVALMEVNVGIMLNNAWVKVKIVKE